MRHTSKLITTSAILGAAAGIYAYKQMSKDNNTNNSSSNSNSSQKASTSTASNTSFNTIETKTVTGYATTPINTPEGNKPITEFSNLEEPNTDTNIKIDMR